MTAKTSEYFTVFSNYYTDRKSGERQNNNINIG